MKLDPLPLSVSRGASPSVPIRTTRLVLVALVVGLVVFAGTSAFVRSTMPPRAETDVVRVLPFVVGATFVVVAAAYLVVRKTTLARLAASKAEALELARQGLLPGPLHALAIVGAALLEGPGLLGAVTLLLGGPWYLVAAPLISALAIAVLIPTRAGVETLVNDLHD